MKVALGIMGIIAIGALGYWWGSVSVSTPSLNENGEYYTVTVVEPERTALADATADAKARQTMHIALGDIVAQFKQDSGLESLTYEDIQIQGLGGERKYVLSIEYDEYHGKRSVSYVYRIYADTLGAHPNGFYRTFTFDTQGKTRALENVFATDTAYLQRLSEQAYVRVLAELSARYGGGIHPEMENTVRVGTAPSPETLQFFYVTETDLHLLFPPYQVAAYAAGSFDIAIPLTELEDILAPEFK